MSNAPCSISRRRIEGLPCYYCSTCDTGWHVDHASVVEASPCPRGATWDQVDMAIDASMRNPRREPQKSLWKGLF